MIVLNAFLKGLAGALGAVLCYALFVVYKYNVSLWKRFWSFVKKNGQTPFSLIDLFLFCAINSLIIWFVCFGIMANTINWRVLSAEGCAVMALLFSIVFCVVIITLFKRYSSKSGINRKLWLNQLHSFLSIKVAPFIKKVQSNIFQKSNTKHPNPNNPITKFNYLFSFQYVPKIIEDYNNRLCSFEVIFDKSKYPSTIKNISNKVEITCNSSKKFRIDTLLISLPSTKAFTEVAAILIYHSVSLHHALMYTLEYSVDEKNAECFVICQMKGDRHFDTGINTKDGKNFLTQTSTHAFLYFAELEKKLSEKTLPEYDNFMAKVKEIFGDDVPHDTDGTSFIEESILKSISCSLDTGIENMLKNIDLSLRLIIQNKNESIFCLAGAANLFIDPIFTAYALYLYHFNRSISFDMILIRVKYYAKLFSSFYFKRTELLVDFAKKHGRMKIAPFVNKQTGEAFKSCAFVDSNDNVTLCAFGSVDFSNDDCQTPIYIAKNKDHLVVAQTKYGTYKLLDNNRLKEERICCFSVMIQNIFSGDDGFHYKIEEPIAPLYGVKELNSDGTMKKTNNENTFAHVVSESVNDIENMLCIRRVLGLP